MVSLIQKRNKHECLNKDEICFTTVDAISKRLKQMKGTCTQMLKVDASHQKDLAPTVSF